MLSTSGNPDIYVIGDGSGTITGWGAFYMNGGSYQVQANGAFTATLNSTHDNPAQLSGSFSSPTQVTLTGSLTGSLTRVPDPSTCAGTWSGSLNETGGPTYPITFTVDSTGAVTSFTGFQGPVTGGMFSESGKVVAFFKTGLDPNSSPYNQIQLNGTLAGNSITGSYEIDESGNSPNGTFTLTKQ